jgi:hypothetical protein
MPPRINPREDLERSQAGGAVKVNVEPPCCQRNRTPQFWRWMRRWKLSRKLLAVRPKSSSLRYFGGLNDEENAEVLKTSSRTVKRDWDFAKSRLMRELNRYSASSWPFFQTEFESTKSRSFRFSLAG